LFIIIAGIYFSIIIVALILAYNAKKFSSSAPKTTIKKLVYNFEKNKYGIITAKIKKMYSTDEDIKTEN
jgi:hypothetical protein